jgi:peptidoglycan/LPS O-acetylase OafA/YrhL
MGKAMCVLGWLACLEACVLDAKLAFFAVGALVWWLEKQQRLRLPPTGPMGIVGCIVGLLLYSTGHVWLAIVGVLPFFVDVVRQEGWIAPLLQSRTMMWFGKISYSLYLVHPFVLDPLRRIGIKLQDRLPNGMAHTLLVIFGVLAALIAGAIANELIEVRLTRSLTAKA